jgi:hypothetical protein
MLGQVTIHFGMAQIAGIRRKFAVSFSIAVVMPFVTCNVTDQGASYLYE